MSRNQNSLIFNINHCVIVHKVRNYEYLKLVKK